MAVARISDGFNGLDFHAIPNQRTIDYSVSVMNRMREHYGELGQRFANTQIGQFAANVIQQTKETYNNYFSSEAIRLAKAARRKITSLFRENDIYLARNIGDLQNAPPIQVRYNMANPGARTWYFDQRTEAYGDAYTNVHGRDIGVDHYDYRRVKNGIVDSVLKDGKWIRQHHHFIEKLLEGDRELDMMEKVTIENNWKLINMMFDEGAEDPLSPSANML